MFALEEMVGAIDALTFDRLAFLNADFRQGALNIGRFRNGVILT